MTAQPMTPQHMSAAREGEVLGHIATLATVAEAKAFRAALSRQGEILTAAAYAALLARIDLLSRRGMLE